MFARRSWTSLIVALAATLLMVTAGCGDNGGNGDDDDQDTGMITDTGDEDPDTGIDDDTDDEEMDAGEEDTEMGDAGGDTSDGMSYVCTFFPDNCGDGQNCYPAQGGGRQCLDHGSTAAGESCSGLNACQDGHACVGSQQNATCQEKCDPDNTEEFGCPEGFACATLADQNDNELPFGACQEVEQNCELYPNDTCGQGQNCYPTQGGGRLCADFNTNASEGDTCGQTAGVDGRCNNNQFCVGTAGGSSRTCRDKCDTEASSSENACASGETCTPLEGDLPFGVCFSN